MLKNKMTWILFLVMVVVLAILVYQIFGLGLKRETNYRAGKVCVKNNCFSVELAENNFQRKKGLMFRDKLEQDSGMLFVFDSQANYPFWMKNTKISLDIIWINSGNKIVYISESVQPCKSFFCPQINPKVNAKYVLEINGELCQKLNIKVGDLVNINTY